jgi:hypothetical protein
MSGPNSEYDPVQVTPLDEEHVSAMRGAALAAIAAAGDLDQLKQVRSGDAGDRSPLAPGQPRDRRAAAAGPARTPASGSARRAARSTMRSRSGRPSSRSRPRRGCSSRRPSTSRCPGTARPVCPAPDHDAFRAHRRRLRRDGLGGGRGAARRGRVAQLRRPQLRTRPPGFPTCWCSQGFAPGSNPPRRREPAAKSLPSRSASTNMPTLRKS